MKEYREHIINGDSREYYYPNLISKMREKNINLLTLSKSLNMNYYQVSRKVNGKNSFSIRDCQLICKLLDDSFENLFFSPYYK